MCGLTGYLHFDGDRGYDAPVIKRMTDSLAHRGPEEEGFYNDGPLTLGHRRLKIIDIEGGKQPMQDRQGNRVIVFNGEIYNYIELRAELRSLGQQFDTDSDTEVVLKAFDQWGLECQNKFNGMWSFAIWDKSERELFLSRDRIGEKPLHYAVFDNSVIFGSEIKALLRYGVPAEPRLELLEIYLTLGNIPAPHTFYKDIYKLMPGHCILVRNQKLQIKKYWQLPDIDERSMLKDKELVNERFTELLTDSVKLRMRSDVPFGAFLSGGLDSSSVVSLMSKVSTSGPTRTFTIGFSDRAFDETELANEVAAKFGTDHHMEEIFPDQFVEIIDRIALHHDEPFGDSSSIPTGYVSYSASKKVKMVLTGDGGDEVLSGYTSYQGIKLTQLINKFPKVLTGAIPILNDSVANFFKGKSRFVLNRVSHVIRTAHLSFDERMCAKAATTDLHNIKILTSKIDSVWSIENYMKEFMAPCTYRDDFYRLMYLNFMHDLPNDYLVKVDRMSMSYSLEARLPFLDHRLVEFMVGVDKSVKMEGWQRKSVLRNTIGRQLPDSVLRAPKKGFSIPIRDWFKEKSFEDQLQANLGKVRDLLHRPTIDRLISENNLGEKDNGDFLWTLMMLNKFL